MQKYNVKFKYIFPFIFILFILNCASEPKLVNRDDEKRTDIIHSNHIIFIGFDGFGSKFIPKASMPNLKQMINEGSSSMDVYNILPPLSWTNWEALFRGTPYYNQNEDNFPSILTVIKGEGKKIAYFYEWSGMKSISDMDNVESIYIDPDLESTVRAADYIKEHKPHFTSIVYSEPDNTGHEKLYGSKAYYKKLELLDSFIQIIIQSTIDAGIYDDTVFIFSSDHGGMFWEHQVNLKSIRKIPLIFFGNGIKKGYKITASVMICDLAPTMTVILGLEAPSQWTGVPIWEIFE